MTYKHKHHIIYKTTFEKTGEYYIGMHCTDNIEDGYLGSGKKLKDIITKQGKRNLKREILAYADNRQQLMALEGFYINKKNLTDKLCLNISSGLSKEKQDKFKNDDNVLLDLQKKYDSRIQHIEQSIVRNNEFIIEEFRRLKDETRKGTKARKVQPLGRGLAKLLEN